MICVNSLSFVFTLFFVVAIVDISATRLNDEDEGVTQQTVAVSVYYETLCPDSVNFIVNELYPTWKKMKSSFTVEWIPYGKAHHFRSEGGPYRFQCQHGAAECKGNMIQACGIHFIDSKDVQMEWIKCLMSSIHPHHAGPQCSAQHRVNYGPIHVCERGSFGKRLLARFGRMTHGLSPRLTFVPTITFNGTYVQAWQRRALNDFEGLITVLTS